MPVHRLLEPSGGPGPTSPTRLEAGAWQGWAVLQDGRQRASPEERGWLHTGQGWPVGSGKGAGGAAGSAKPWCCEASEKTSRLATRGNLDKFGPGKERPKVPEATGDGPWLWGKPRNASGLRPRCQGVG